MNSKGVYAIFQKDGNFVIYNGPNALWSSGTHGKNGVKLMLRRYGNLVLFDADDKPIWSSKSSEKGKQPYQLVMQDDQNLVLYGKGGVPIWASNTQLK